MKREEAIEYLKRDNGNCDTDCKYCKYNNDCRSYKSRKMAIKALEQQPCEDEYIKIPKKALKYRIAGMVAYNAEWLKNHFDIERTVICGEQQPCKDAINREKLIKDLNFLYNEDGFIKDTRAMRTMEVIMGQLPVNLQEPKTGHWIEEINDYGKVTGWHCDKCYEDSGFTTICKWDFCPNCGSYNGGDV